MQFCWERASNIGLRKKNIIKKIKFLIFNLKLLLFLKENVAINFFKKLKDEIGNKEKYEEFFEYFESTWLAIEENKKSKIEFKFWSYSEYLDKTKKKEKKLIDTDLLKNKVFDSNNYCNCVENINHLINS